MPGFLANLVNTKVLGTASYSFIEQIGVGVRLFVDRLQIFDRGKHHRRTLVLQKAADCLINEVEKALDVGLVPRSSLITGTMEHGVTAAAYARVYAVRLELIIELVGPQSFVLA